MGIAENQKQRVHEVKKSDPNCLVSFVLFHNCVHVPHFNKNHLLAAQEGEGRREEERGRKQSGSIELELA